MSAGDSSDSCSDGEMDTETPLSVFVPSDTPPFNTMSPPSSPYQQKQRQSSPSAPTPSTTSSSSTTPTKSSSTTPSQPPILSPLVYQTPQGMMYATPSSGGMILSLAQGDPGSAHPQFITIPLSMVAANGQGELDLSKRK